VSCNCAALLGPLFVLSLSSHLLLPHPTPTTQVTKLERKCAAYREELRSLQSMHDGLQSEHTAGGQAEGWWRQAGWRSEVFRLGTMFGAASVTVSAAAHACCCSAMEAVQAPHCSAGSSFTAPSRMQQLSCRSLLVLLFIFCLQSVAS